jgi:hypothetical protein
MFIEDRVPELPVYTDTELEVYRLQMTALIASKLSIWDLTPKMESDLRAAIIAKDPESLTMLDTLVSAYRQYCKAVTDNTSNQWDLRSETETRRRDLVDRFNATT